MKNKRPQSKLKAFIRELMVGKTQEEINSATHSFRAYIELAQEVQRRISKEKKDLKE